MMLGHQLLHCFQQTLDCNNELDTNISQSAIFLQTIIDNVLLFVQ